MSVADLPNRFDQETLAEFCRTTGIRRLFLFGSVLRDDFDPERSDVDVRADFNPGGVGALGLRHFAYGNEPSLLLRRRVDFCSRLNQHMDQRARRKAITIYEQA